ncbi:peroxisomal membrane protein PEX16 [Ctenocephalides felis]|uniref:peroxisomal membrane protein PEX16 n=1 Tax=Ctenocephalides felis TaxID=7515 RepID=UPI000E6E2D44|nr:peroxisomal membrane protein PEX16 [Ctenocephalides felis]
MMPLHITLYELYTSYEKWVSTHPHLVNDAETIVKWLSYFIAGRMNTSNVVTELIYSLSNLLVLFNDRIIYKSRKINYRPDEVTKLKLLLTTVEYCEVFIELSVKRYLGDKAKWIVIALLQIYKCLGRLILLYYYDEEIIQSPPVPPLQRRKEIETTEQVISEPTLSFTLKRSGRILRKVDTAPPKELRTWNPPQSTEKRNCRVNKGSLTTAETLYIIKPLAHLVAMRTFGTESWKMWLISLGFDISSLRLFSKATTSETKVVLTKQQRIELSRRCLMLFMYLMRSPCYDRYTKDAVISVLNGIGNKIPFANSVVVPILQYLPHWQKTYFYMWSG